MPPTGPGLPTWPDRGCLPLRAEDSNARGTFLPQRRFLAFCWTPKMASLEFTAACRLPSSLLFLLPSFPSTLDVAQTLDWAQAAQVQGQLSPWLAPSSQTSPLTFPDFFLRNSQVPDTCHAERFPERRQGSSQKGFTTSLATTWGDPETPTASPERKRSSASTSGSTPHLRPGHCSLCLAPSAIPLRAACPGDLKGHNPAPLLSVWVPLVCVRQLQMEWPIRFYLAFCGVTLRVEFMMELSSHAC